MRNEMIDAIDQLLDACAISGVSLDEQLIAVELSWLAIAAGGRDAALSIPGGFAAAQARQLDHLEKMGLLVRDAEPDLEAERLFQQGDLKRLLDHSRQLGLDGDSGG